MNMHKPPHPSEFIQEVFMTPFGHSCRYISKKLEVAPSTLSRVLKGQSCVSPEMALKLSKTLGRSPESWLTMQNDYDLWLAKQKVNLEKLQPIEF